MPLQEAAWSCEEKETMARTVIGLFDTQNDAQAALRELQQAGFGDSMTYVENGSSSLVSNLGNAGVPQEDAQIYANEVGRGGSLIILQALGTSDADNDERVTVERRPLNQAVDPSVIDQVAQSGTLEVREHDEQAVVAKEARVVEEVVVNKQVEERNETIQDTVRRTEVDVDQLAGQTRSVGSTSTTSAVTSGDEGLIERGLSQAENAAERVVGSDLNQDGGVGRRDPRNNV
jgi:hypothetical protein